MSIDNKLNSINVHTEETVDVNTTPLGKVGYLLQFSDVIEEKKYDENKLQFMAYITDVLNNKKTVNGVTIDSKITTKLLFDMDSSLVTGKFAYHLDKTDPLKEFRKMFHMPKWNKEGETLEFRGNSLGAQPRNVKDHILRELDIWKKEGHEGHFAGNDDGDGRLPWWRYHEWFQSKLANLYGCDSDEVIPMGTLSANNVSMLNRFYAISKREGRNKIIIEEGLFPSDLDSVKLVICQQLSLLPDEIDDYIIMVKRREDNKIHTEDIKEAIDNAGSEFAMTFLGGVNYYTGQLMDVREITKYAQQNGGFAGFDMAHAGGNIKLELSDMNVDFANFCSYKYMNSGPGGTGSVYCNKIHHNNPFIAMAGGWRSRDKDDRFTFDSSNPVAKNPAKGARRLLMSNDEIMSLAPMMASLKIFEKAGMDAISKKSKLITGYLEYLLETVIGGEYIDIITPRNPSERGAQLSFRIKGDHLGSTGQERAQLVGHELEKKGVGVEQRDDIIRATPTPLYNTYREVHKFVNILDGIINKEDRIIGFH